MSQKLAKITGFDATLLNRFSVILDTINSGYMIDEDKFRQYALETARMYAALYPWYQMPSSYTLS